MQFGVHLRFYFFTNYRYVQLVAEHVMTKGIRDQVDLLHRYSHEEEVLLMLFVILRRWTR